ncbi:hypothetical protein [Clostridium sp. JN-1]|uniref:hypothetical protein n=1 Tax=Clostridium sp. JN-1 TaxID=2483110 RepID=UPI000F0BD15D|nr:hypothetical protein [Clostridium sp. JN-1]
MSRTSGKRGLLAFVTILIIAVVVFFALLFSGSSYRADKVELSSDLINKMQIAALQTGTIELNGDELNQIINMYFTPKKYSNITVKGIKSEIVGSDVNFYIPVNYKGLNLLMKVSGNLTYDYGINYKVSNVSLGKIPVPKKLFLDIVRSKAGNRAAVKDDTIYIDKSKIPVSIKSIDVEDSKMIINVEKLTDQIKNKLQSMVGQTSSGTGSSAQVNKSLDRISGKLNAALNSVDTQGEKAVISSMISSVNKMKSNSNGSPDDYASQVKVLYRKLSESEKQKVKTAVFSNVDGNDLDIVKSMIN